MLIAIGSIEGKFWTSTKEIHINAKVYSLLNSKVTCLWTLYYGFILLLFKLALQTLMIVIER
jgi:hypothetical protein